MKLTLVLVGCTAIAFTFVAFACVAIGTTRDASELEDDRAIAAHALHDH